MYELWKTDTTHSEDSTVMVKTSYAFCNILWYGVEAYRQQKLWS